MRKIVVGFFLTASIALIPASAAEKDMMHCFAFTPIATATGADWEAFWKATDQWPAKYKGVRHVWYGKLRRPLNQFRVDAESAKKFKTGDKVEGASVERLVRQYGVCMAMDPADPELKNYLAHPFHKEWTAAYEKVRVAGTTTYDILPQ